MAKRFAFPGILCAAACSQYSINPNDGTGSGDDDGKAPRIEVTPTTLDFGEDFDIVGGAAPITQTVTVKNIGEETLHIFDLYLQTGEPSYDVSSISSLVLGVGASAEFTVTFQPEQPFAHPEHVLIDSDDPETPTAAVDINGSGVAPKIEVDPITLDFGYLDVGCERPETITITNVGNADLVLDEVPQFIPTDPNDMYFFPGPDYLHPDSALVFPLTIPAAEFVEVQIIYAPLNEVDDKAQLSVKSNDPYLPEVHADQTAGILGAKKAEDLFEQPAQPMTDIVFIVDNSGSMTEEQANLANNFDYFIYALQSSNADYQIGVITDRPVGFPG